MEESGKDSAELQRVADDEQSIQVEGDKVSVSQRTGVTTPHNKRTYGGKGRVRAVHRATADGVSTSPSNVNSSRNADTEEVEEEEMIEKVPVSHLPKRRRGRPPKKSKPAPEEDWPSKKPTLASQPTTQEYQIDGLGSNDKGECVLQLYTD